MANLNSWCLSILAYAPVLLLVAVAPVYGFTVSDLEATEQDLRLSALRMLAFEERQDGGRPVEASSKFFGYSGSANAHVGTENYHNSLQEDLFVLHFGLNDVLRYSGVSGDFIEDFVVGSSPLAPASMVFGGPNNNLFISQSDGGNVFQYDLLTGDFVNEFVASGLGGLSNPSGLVFAGTGGNLLVADALSGRILEFNALNGSYIGDFAFLSGMRAGEITFAHSNLFVIDQASSAVQRFDSQGNYLGVFVSSLDSPADFVFGPNGNLFITVGDFQASRVEQYDGLTGAFLGIFASENGLSDATGLDFGPDGNLYVASSSTASILEFNGSTGAFEGIFIPSGSEGLNNPDDIFFQEIPEPLPGFAFPMIGALGWMAWQMRKRKLS